MRRRPRARSCTRNTPETLNRTDAGVHFSYVDGYDGPAVAATLPLSSEPVLRPAGAVPPFFSGLLPEGRRLAALRRQVKTSADDELSLLVAVGAVQGRKRENITRATMLDLAEAIGLRPRAARSAIDTLVDAVDDWLPELETLPFDQRRIHRLRRVILDRRARLANSG
ncbi:hypothetical protein BH23ACT9_BH23ACT9_20100 [soil metagenome]